MTVQFRPNVPHAVLPLEGICQVTAMPLAVRRHPRVWDPPSTAHINHTINEAGLTEVGELCSKSTLSRTWFNQLVSRVCVVSLLDCHVSGQTCVSDKSSRYVPQG